MAWQFASGEILTAANLNAVTKPWNAVCQVSKAAMSLVNTTVTPVTFDTEDLDPLSWHSTVSLTDRVVPTIAGWYSVGATVRHSADTDYTRVLGEIFKNGAAVSTPLWRMDLQLSWGGGSPTPAYTFGAPRMVSLNGSTDYVSLQLLQTNTSAATNTADALFTVKLEYPT